MSERAVLVDFPSGIERQPQKTGRLDSVAPAFSEEDLALRFAEKHEGHLRYVPKWGWMHWDGSVWKPDDQLNAFNLSRGVCRQAARECNESQQKRNLGSAKTVAAIERLARADRRLIANTEQWDAD